MRKWIFILLSSIIALSCKKDKKVCWKCQLVINGTAQEVEKCDHGSGRFQDDQGNDLQCIEIH